MGSVSETNTLPEPSVAAAEGAVPVSGVAVEALAEAEQKTPETVDASNPPEEGSAEPAAKRQKLTLEEQCERLVAKLEQSFEVNKEALNSQRCERLLTSPPEVGTRCQLTSE